MKKYKDFIKSINESSMDIDTIRKERIEFDNDMYSLSNKRFSNESFSDIAKKNKRIEDHFDYLLKQLDKIGWNWNRISSVFSKESDDIIGESIIDIYNRRYDEKNGETDLIFYKLVKDLGLDTNKIPLGGEGWLNYDDEDELLIRYSYGYHKTEYGKLMMEQTGNTLESLYKKASEIKMNSIVKDWPSFIRSLIYTFDIIFTSRSHDNYFIVDTDRLIINFGYLLEDILDKNNTSNIDLDILIDRFEKHISSKYNVGNNNIIDDLLEIIRLGDELVIYQRELKE